MRVAFDRVDTVTCIMQMITIMQLAIKHTYWFSDLVLNGWLSASSFSAILTEESTSTCSHLQIAYWCEEANANLPMDVWQLQQLLGPKEKQAHMEIT